MPTRGSKRRAEGLVVTPSKVLGEGRSTVEDGKVRLNHFLAMSGVCSRRGADELIEKGRVQVNGEPVTELGLRVDPVVDEVRFDGSRLQPERPVYVLLNKPKGVVCTNAPHEQKKRVIDLLPQIRGRIFTVGRLDMDSEGLLLVTNDGSFAQEMTHPRYGISKLYAITVRGRVEDAALGRARGGVWLSEGPTGGMDLKIERVGKDRTFLKVTLREGKNREIRRVFAKLGHPVISLKRVRIGSLSLHRLSDGKWRFLEASEVAELRVAARAEKAEAPVRKPQPRPSAARPPALPQKVEPQRGGNKPAARGSAASRSTPSRPSTSRPSAGRPSAGRPSAGRPSSSRPSSSRPSAGKAGGGKLVGRPGASRSAGGGRPTSGGKRR